MAPDETEIKKSTISQFEDGLGIFVRQNFKKGEIVIQWNLKEITFAIGNMETSISI